MTVLVIVTLVLAYVGVGSALLYRFVSKDGPVEAEDFVFIGFFGLFWPVFVPLFALGKLGKAIVEWRDARKKRVSA